MVTQIINLDIAFNYLAKSSTAITPVFTATDYTIANDTAVWIPLIGSVFFTSEGFITKKNSEKVYFSSTVIDTSDNAISSVLTRPPLVNPRGGISFNNQLFVCEAGDDYSPSRLSVVDPVDFSVSYLFDREFASLSDAALLPLNNSIWLLDSSPQLAIIYSLDLDSRKLTPVFSTTKKVERLAFSPNSRRCYLSEPSTCTIFVADLEQNDQTFTLGNERVFHTPIKGLQTVRVDTCGHVYAANSDGIKVLGPRGELLGEFVFSGGVKSFTFAEPGTMYVLNGQSVFKVTEMCARGL